MLRIPNCTTTVSVTVQPCANLLASSAADVVFVTTMSIVILLNPAGNHILLTHSTSIRSSAALPSINHKLHNIFAGTFDSSYSVYRSLKSKIKTNLCSYFPHAAQTQCKSVSGELRFTPQNLDMQMHEKLLLAASPLVPKITG